MGQAIGLVVGMVDLVIIIMDVKIRRMVSKKLQPLISEKYSNTSLLLVARMECSAPLLSMPPATSVDSAATEHEVMIRKLDINLSDPFSVNTQNIMRKLRRA